MSELRSENRFRAVVYCLVDNRDTGEELGHLVDLSEQGLQVAVPEPIEIGSTWRLVVILHEAEGEARQFEVAVQNRWCRRTSTLDGYSCGMKIKTISRDDARLVAKLTRQSSFQAYSD